MKTRSTMPTLLLILFLLPGALMAQSEAFEIMEPGAEALGVCQTAHRIADCSGYHVDGITLSVQGPLLDLNGQLYLVEWTGPGYYLDSGVILQPLGEAKADLGGQRWLEVYPEQGKIHTSRAWQDEDGNRVLSVSDTLTLGPRKASKPFKVKDVRLQFRASPVAAESQAEQRQGLPERVERVKQN